MVAFRAELQFDGEKTPESVAAAMQQILAAGIPGNARLSFVNGPSNWTATASWIADAAPEPAPDFREANLEAIQEQIDNPLDLNHPGNAPGSETLQP